MGVATGIRTSTGAYPHIRFMDVSAAASCGTTWANQIQTTIIQIQQDMVNAKGGVSTLASYLNQLFGSGGGLTTGDHDTLLGVASNQHHRRLHGAQHTNSTWSLVSSTGESTAYSLAEHASYLYAGTGNNGKVFRTLDGNTWVNVANLGGAVRSLASFGNYIYAGMFGGAIYRSDDGVTWSVIYNTLSSEVRFLHTFDSQIYAATHQRTGLTAEIFRSADGETWTSAANIGEQQIYCLEEFDSKFYAGTAVTDKIYESSDGASWSSVHSAAGDVRALKTFGTDIYAGCTGGKIYSSPDGSAWSEAYDTGETAVYAMEVYTDYLYASTGTDGKLFRTPNGSSWAEVTAPSANDISYLIVYDGDLYAGLVGNGEIHRYLALDLIQTASATQPGLMTTTSFTKLQNLSTQGTADKWNITGYFTGDGTTQATTVLGFRPAWVEIQDKRSTHSVWQTMDGATYAFKHFSGSAGAAKHSRLKASEAINIYTHGFTAFDANLLNSTGVTYFYTAIKET